MCLASCPTGALVEPGVLDSTRCLSYLTIETKGALPEEYRAAIGAHAYGCDICQDVCPYNQQPTTAVSADPAWQPREGLDGPRLLDLWSRSDDELRTLLKGSAMKRAGVRRLRRNLAVAIGNSGGPEAAQALESHDAPTCHDPLVEEHIAGRWDGWARSGMTAAEARSPASHEAGRAGQRAAAGTADAVVGAGHRGGCKACDLYKRGTQTVFGEGPRKARVMLVGEQPGDAEDVAGHPFVGPAGKLLDTALEQAGIDRRQVYVTNVVKHFKWEPRGKRRIHAKPNAAEIAACRPWLETEIAPGEAARPGLPRCDRGAGLAGQVLQGVEAARRVSSSRRWPRSSPRPFIRPLSCVRQTTRRAVRRCGGSSRT